MPINWPWQTLSSSMLSLSPRESSTMEKNATLFWLFGEKNYNNNNNKKPWAPKGRESVTGMPSSRRAGDGWCYQRWRRFMIITDKLSAKMNASERLEIEHTQRLLEYSDPPPPALQPGDAGGRQGSGYLFLRSPLWSCHPFYCLCKAGSRQGELCAS